jgi:uncharacterized membrane protein YraQ (UPF0718 family)
MYPLYILSTLIVYGILPLKNMKHKKKNFKNKPSNQKVNSQKENLSNQTIEAQVVEIEKNTKYALPIKEIKKDLYKTFAYAIFALLAIVALNYFLPKTGLKLDLSSYKFF